MQISRRLRFYYVIGERVCDGTPEVVVITGASAGVGRATVRKFAKQGARIGLIARGIDGLKGAQKEVGELGSKALVFPVDIRNADRVEAAAAQIECDLGEIDIWINNAMASVFSPVKEMTPEEFRRVTEVTYLGCVYGTLAALKRMLPRNRGVIVQIGSPLAYRGIPLQAAYCAAKHAIQGLRFVAMRVTPRQEQCTPDNGAVARAKHAATRVGKKPSPTQGATGAAYLSARSRSGSDLFRCASSAS